MMLVDTNIFVDHLRGYMPAARFFESIAQNDAVIFSAITEAELIAGKECSDANKKEVVLHFLHRYKKIPVSNQVAVLAGDLSREYGLEIPDAIIAATAVINKAEIVTRNTKDFKSIPNLEVKSPY